MQEINLEYKDVEKANQERLAFYLKELKKGAPNDQK